MADTNGNRPGGISRRGFFAATAVTAAAGAASGFFGARLVEYLGCAPDTPWRSFTPEEVPAMEALAEQIVPTDRDPGAREARAARFVDWQIAPGAPYERFREQYRTGLAALDAAARSAHGKGFAECTFDMQKALLEKVEREGGDLARFFATAIDHVKQGFYGCPGHGGNEGYASYRMLGIAGPACTGRSVPS